jgi:glutathione-regulated potassium-efflux system ancillary protein KefG
MMNVLLLYIHPDHAHSHANRPLRDALIAQLRQAGHQVTLHDLYHQHPDGFIHIAPERALVQSHDMLLVQHPMYWFSAPSLFKEWLDRVVTSDWAFGSQYALAGKRWLQVVSTGGSANDFLDSADRASIQSLLKPFEITARFCRMHWLPPVALYSADSATPEAISACASAAVQTLAQSLAQSMEQQ